MSHLPTSKRKLNAFLASKKFYTSFLALAFFLVSNLNAQKVGINTDSPMAGLHVISDDGLLIQGEYGIGTSPVSGAGTRLLFNPKTGAFRAGRLTDEDGGIYAGWWDFINVGDYSIVAGVNTKASGYASAAFGHKNQALGLAAFAAGGRANMASGSMSFVAGFENNAPSYLEFVTGQYSSAYTPNSMTGFDLHDRLFVIGNGINPDERHNALTILKNGNTGIGTDTPQSLLEVNGVATMNKAVVEDSLQSKYLRLTDGAADGYLLKSDANGQASWTSPTSLFNNYWTANGNDIYNVNPANIGIGTDSPSAKLHVVGNMILDASHLSFENTGSSIFIGKYAGEDDDLSNNANVFIGETAGEYNVDGVNNIAIGNDALQQGISAGNNIGIGKSALHANQTGSSNIAMGIFAMSTNSSGSDNLALGFLSLNQNTSGSGNVGLGTGTLTANTMGSGNVAEGLSALHNNTIGNSNIGVGEYTLFLNKSGSQNVSIGHHALESGMSGSNNVALGYYAGNSNTGSSNTLIGFEAGKMNNGSSNVFIGNQAGSAETGSNKLYIENSNTSSPLIYGDFQNNKLIINDSLQSKYLHATMSAEVEGDLNLNDGKILFTNTGESIFIGQGAGDNDDLSYNSNVFIGQNAGQTTTTGADNIAMGSNALLNNTTGNANIGLGEFSLYSTTTGNINVAVGQHALEANQTGVFNIALGFSSGYSATGNDNTFIGHEAGFSTTGSGNIFLGRQAGYDETGSNKLYIDNSNTTAPLIYGDFTTNKVTINDSLATKHLVATQSSQVNGLLNIKAGKISFTNTGQSVFIGDQAGAMDDLSNNNSVFIGHQAGQANTSGTNNIAIGAFALDAAATTNYNIAMGQDVLGSASLSGGYNTGIGNFSLANVTSGVDNLAFGQNTGGAINEGTRNVAIGNYALDAATSGSFNTTIGYESLGSNATGISNTIVGYFAGNAVTGNHNVMVGFNAGLATTGSNNVMIGSEAGAVETGSNKLYIDNSSTSTPLIQGDFTTNEITINDSLSVNKELSVGTSIANSTLEVNGSVAAKFKTPLVAGTTNPDGSGMVWRYNSGTGTITLPAASSCANRMYVIINQTGQPRTISSYRDLTTTPSTMINSSVALWLMSDGAEWWQIK